MPYVVKIEESNLTESEASERLNGLFRRQCGIERARHESMPLLVARLLPVWALFVI